MKRSEIIDGQTRRLVETSVASIVTDEGQTSQIVDAVMNAIMPHCGAEASRRRSESDMRSALKDGFLMGRNAGRFARWHDIIWRASETCKRMRTMAADKTGAAERFSRYNFE